MGGGSRPVTRPAGDRWHTIVDRIDRHLEDFLPRAMNDEALEGFVGPPDWQHDAAVHSAMLSIPVWDLINRGGKRWRPIFGLLLLESLGRSSEPYEGMLVATAELCHTGALIIDDIEDEAKFRRGGESIHLKYGTDVAISAANTLYFLPHLQYADHPQLDDHQRLEIYRSMVRQLVRAHFGQAMDIFWSRNLTADTLEKWLGDGLAQKILQMYAYKTGSGLEGIAEMACTIASAGPQTLSASVALARNMGVAFQIVDDVLDFEGCTSWSKAVGHDLAVGQPTYVIVRAIERSSDPARRRLIDLLTGTPHDGNLGAAISLVMESGALDECRSEAAELFERGWSEFSHVVPDSPSRSMLYELCDRLIEGQVGE
jgi:geranylgeranyl diphosphate synthase type I